MDIGAAASIRASRPQGQYKPGCYRSLPKYIMEVSAPLQLERLAVAAHLCGGGRDSACCAAIEKCLQAATSKSGSEILKPPCRGNAGALDGMPRTETSM